jgi:hypothetical protein
MMTQSHLFNYLTDFVQAIQKENKILSKKLSVKIFLTFSENSTRFVLIYQVCFDPPSNHQYKLVNKDNNLKIELVLYRISKFIVNLIQNILAFLSIE